MKPRRGTSEMPATLIVQGAGMTLEVDSATMLATFGNVWWCTHCHHAGGRADFKHARDCNRRQAVDCECVEPIVDDPSDTTCHSCNRPYQKKPLGW